MLRDYFIFAINSLRSRKMRSWLTMIGIFIGIAAVVSLISLGQGMKNAITSQFENLGTDKLVVQAAETGFGPPGSTAIKRVTTNNMEAIEKINGVKLTAARYIRTMTFEKGDYFAFKTASTIPDKEAGELVIEAMDLEVAAGRMLKDGDKKKALIGADYLEATKDRKAIRVGDKIELEGEEFEAIGILEKMGNPLFNGIIILKEEPFKELLDIEEDVDMIVVQLEEGADPEVVATRIEKVMRKERDVEEGKEDFSVTTPLQTIESINSILDAVTAVLVGIALISLIVGGVGIMNTMYTSVVERRREIGIMKSIGARNSSIFILFLIESGVLGTAGGLIGIIIGVVLSKIVVGLASILLGPGILSAEFSLFLIIGSLMFSFIVGGVSGVLPAYQASKLHPVDALRK